MSITLKVARPAQNNVFDSPPIRMRWLHAIRIHHWVKSFLIFVPLIAAHQIHDVALLTRSVIAFFAFCFMSSSVYVINDLLDIESDRKCQLKRRRPFASGALEVVHGTIAIPILFVIGTGLGSLLSGSFVLMLLAYFGLTLIYSLLIKRILIADVVWLACLYTFRILAGGVATEIPVTDWLLAFAIFFFFSLALAKRSSDLLRSESMEPGWDKRGYAISDIHPLKNIGIASGLCALLVLGIYINSEHVQLLYDKPFFLWLLVPLFLYWVSRLWILVNRRQLNTDPIIFTFRDTPSYIVAASAAVILLAASGKLGW